MGKLEAQVANVGIYTSVKHMLQVEQLLLAVIRKNTSIHAPAALAQFERVQALETVLAMFVANLESPTQGTSHE